MLFYQPLSNYLQKHALDLPCQDNSDQPSQASHPQNSILHHQQRIVKGSLNAALTVYLEE